MSRVRRPALELKEAAYRILRLPTVADKTFLISIGDRSVGGHDGPRPDGRSLAGAGGRRGGDRHDLPGLPRRGLRHGRAHPLAVLDARLRAAWPSAKQSPTWPPPTSGTWARSSSRPTGWPPAASPARTPACSPPSPPFRISARPSAFRFRRQGFALHAHRLGAPGRKKQVVSPLSLIVTAFAPSTTCAGPSPAVADRPGRNRTHPPRPRQEPPRRLGPVPGFNATGSDAPDLDDPAKLWGLFEAIQRLNRDGLLLAYHDRSDGGLLPPPAKWPLPAAAASPSTSTACATTPAARRGRQRKKPDLLGGRSFELLVRALFNGSSAPSSRPAGPTAKGHAGAARLGVPTICRLPQHERRNPRRPQRPQGAAETRIDLQRAWSETSYQMQTLRDNPSCARQEYDRILDGKDPGLSPRLVSTPRTTSPPPTSPSVTGPRRHPSRAGVNSHYEMAAAFDRPGSRPSTST